MTLGEAQERIDSAEFAEWLAYYSLEPFGADRNDIVTASLAALTFNIHKTKDAAAATMQDFLPKFAEREDSDAKMKAQLMAFAQMHNKRIKKQKTKKRR